MLICIFNRSKLCMLMFIYVGDEHVYRYGYIYISHWSMNNVRTRQCNPNRNADECKIQSQTPNFESM